MAFCAATAARSAPVASPVPIMALPMPPITLSTSAKSRLIRPGNTMRSVIERTPECSTWSAIPNASAKVVCSVATRNRFWFGTMIEVSTYCCSSCRPASARRMRWRPSNRNGLETTPTVRMPRSRAQRATNGAAPVPVPPPMPAVMNTMSAPSR